jgi:ketosteroid isomerase-like protein
MTHPNTDVIRKWAQAIGQKDMTAAANLLTDDARWHVGGRNPVSGDYTGKDDIVDRFLPALDKAYDRIDIDLHDLLASEDHVVAILTRTAHRGGRSMEQRAVAVYHVRDGKIAEGWVVEADQYGTDEFLSS